MASKKWRLNWDDVKKQGISALLWLRPMALVYLAQLFFALKQKGLLGWGDFYPDPFTWGAIQLYVLNQLNGLFNKAKAGK